MAEQNLVQEYEQIILDYLRGDQTDRGSGGEGDLLRLYWSLGRERDALVQAMENILRRDDAPEVVKCGILDIASGQRIWELEDAVRELDAHVSTDVSAYVPGALPRSITSSLRLFINRFIVFRRGVLRDRG